MIVAGLGATVWATSELASSDGRYGAAMAFDGDPTTAWVEGVVGYGGAFEAGEVLPSVDPMHTPERTNPGERLGVTFDDLVAFDGVALRPGFLKSRRLYERNGVPVEVEVLIDGVVQGSYTLPLATEMVFENAGENGPDARDDGCYPIAADAYAENRLVVFRRPVRGREMSVRLVHVGIGQAHEDTAIAEALPLLTSRRGPLAAVVRAVRDPSTRLRGASIQDVRDLYFNALSVVEMPGERRPNVTLAARDDLPIPSYDAVAATLLTPPRTALDAYVGAFGESLRNNALLVTRDGIVTGTVARSDGDGEWAELRPQLAMNPDGTVRSARVVVAFGGAPGCHDNLRTLRSTPTTAAPSTQTHRRQ